MQNKIRSAKTFKKPAPVVAATTASGSNVSDTDNAMQFELELTWCISSLETALATGKLSDKVADHTLKNIKILKSKTTPMIKKRQVMKAACGDYRSIMKEEEKKMGLAARQIKFTTNVEANKATSSSFVKKSALLASGKDFRFNFNPPTSSESSSEQGSKSQLNEAATTNVVNNLKFTGGNSGFKFNFNIPEAGEINIEGLSIKN